MKISASVSPSKMCQIRKLRKTNGKQQTDKNTDYKINKRTKTQGKTQQKSAESADVFLAHPQPRHTAVGVQAPGFLFELESYLQ